MFKITALLLMALFAFGCSTGPKPKTAQEISSSKEFKPGKLVVIQGPTSATEANINVLSPVLKNYSYVVVDKAGQKYPAEKYDTVHTAPLHWKIDKVFVSGLKPGVTYTLQVQDSFRGSITNVDTRFFSTLDTAKTNVRFAYASCMADDYRFNEVINPMWDQMRSRNPDMIILNGDLVYVDSFEFVERQKATELDIWFRFIDSFQRLPVYHWENLKPIFATWDDHDFGTNDSDRTFKSKEAARRVFLAFFGGKNLKDTYTLESDSVYFSLTAFKQKMFFMDDRYFRQPNKDQKVMEKYAHWGEKQHKWLMNHLSKDKTPAWIFNGNQIFSGGKLSYKESLQDSDPEHYKQLLEDMKKTTSPTLFASGDIHFSEIMELPADRIGYKTYEVTSSSMHSYAYEGWDNPLRVPGAFTKSFNFMIINSHSTHTGLNVSVEAWGLQSEPLFKTQFEVKKE